MPWTHPIRVQGLSYPKISFQLPDEAVVAGGAEDVAVAGKTAEVEAAAGKFTEVEAAGGVAVELTAAGGAGTARLAGSRNHTWVRPKSEKPMYPRTFSFIPPSTSSIEHL